MQPYEELEREWASFNDLDPSGMVACSSGTAALHLALEALRLPKGSEVAVPDYTMVACARAVTLAGLIPTFIDCDRRLLMDPSLLQERSHAVMAVHVFGRQCDMDEITYYADDHIVIEDLAEAHGVPPHEGTDAACWSFYRNKIVAGEEGGAVWFRSSTNAALARELRTLGFTSSHDFVHTPRGHNYRMSNVHADIILSRLSTSLEEILRPREEIEGWYNAACPSEWRMPMRDVPWVYDVRIPGLTRNKQKSVVARLNEDGIEARMGFWPMSRQPEYICPINAHASLAANEVFYLPIRPGEDMESSCRSTFDVILGEIGS